MKKMQNTAMTLHDFTFFDYTIKTIGFSKLEHKNFSAGNFFILYISCPIEIIFLEFS